MAEPFQHASSCVLPDGRRLAYCVHGDPDGAPVLLFHGLPGSRFQKNPDTSIAASLGLRVITVDRPGCGASDPSPRRHIRDWPADVSHLLDALDLGGRRVALGGWSGGGPYIASCAAAMPERFSHVLFISSLAPLHDDSLIDGMQGFFRMVFRMARRTPWMLDAIMPIWRGVLQNQPDRFLRVVQRGLSQRERAMLRDPALRDLFISTLLDGSSQGKAGPPLELRLAARDWGVPLGAIRLPVQVWHGESDSTVPVSMGRALAAAIPGAALRIFPGEGHFLVFTRWREALEALAAVPERVHQRAQTP